MVSGCCSGSSPVRRGSPAEAAGLKPGDVIIEAAGRRIRDADQLISVIGLGTVGDDVPITVLRGQIRIETRVQIR